MISGTMAPSSGTIERSGLVSWPIGFSGGYHGDLTGLQNTRFVARIYGVSTDQLVDFVQEFSGLGDHFRLPVRTYSQGMRARLGFAVSMGIEFDTYLIDEVTSVGDAAFREKCEISLMERLTDRTAVVVSHNLQFLKRVCNCGIVIEQGRAHWFDNVSDAIDLHRDLVHS